MKFSTLTILLLIISCTPVQEQASEEPLIIHVGAKQISQTISIISFNIQDFGSKKSSNETIMTNVKRILDGNDIIIIQEVSDASNTTKLNLQKAFPTYELLLSERLGSTKQKEQYAILYNPKGIDVNAAFVEIDQHQKYEREPLIMNFQVGNKNHSIITIHTKPEQAESEIKALAYTVSKSIQELHHDNWIIIGDLNADCTYYNPNNQTGTTQSWYWAIPDEADTTTKNTNCAYDRIITSPSLVLNVENAEVYNYETELNITNAEAQKISDHYPVRLKLKTED